MNNNLKICLIIYKTMNTISKPLLSSLEVTASEVIDYGIPDINTTPLIGKTSDTTDKTLQFTLKPDLEKSNTAFDDPTISEKLESKDLQNLSQSDLVKPKTIVTSAIDDPETADELESNQLQLLTNFKVEDNPQNESSNEKSIDIK